MIKYLPRRYKRFNINNIIKVVLSNYATKMLAALMLALMLAALH